MIYIIGCNHGIQQEGIGDTQENAQGRAGQREHFAQLIAETLGRNEIQLVCEEWSHEGRRTIARCVADEHGLCWLNIEATPTQLRDMGISTPLYTRLPIPNEKKAIWHALREKFMVCIIKKNRVDSQNLLVVCGFDHMLPLSDLLRQGIGDVKVVDYRKMSWYRPDVFLGDGCNPDNWNTE